MQINKFLEKGISNVNTISLAQSIFGFVKTKLKEAFYDNFVIYENDELFGYLEEYIYDKYPGIGGLTEAHINGSIENGVKSDSPTDGSVILPSLKYRKVSGDFNIVYKGRRIYISKDREKIDSNSNSTKGFFFNQYMLSAIDGNSYIKGFLNEVSDYAVKKRNKQQVYVYTHSEDGYWYRSNSIRFRDLKNIILPAKIKETIIKDLNDFTTSKSWYNDRGIPYKRSYLFTGPPGNGKSSLSTGMSSYLDRSIYVLNLATLRKDSDLRQAFNGVTDNSILLIEDIDSVMDGRTIIAKGTNVTFSGILNVMDGVFYKEGLITIITTNHPEKLDPAITRKGRVDQAFNIPNPDKESIELYLKMFYGIDILLKQGSVSKQIPMSEVQDICIRNKDNADKAIRDLNKIIK